MSKQEESLDPNQSTEGEEITLRRSERESKPTPRMEEYLEDESVKRNRKLRVTYEQWKSHVKGCKSKLQDSCSDYELGEMIDSITNLERNVIGTFEQLRHCCVPTPDIVRRVDACSAVSVDLIKIVNERISGVEEYDSGHFHRQLLNNKYAKSVFSLSSVKSDSSLKSVMSVKVIDAATDLANKRAELAALEVDERHQEQIRLMDKQQRDLARIGAKRDIAAAEARLSTYASLMKDDISVHSEQQSSVEQPPAANNLAKALAESINLNRIPVPEPSVFMGDPLEYLEWKTSFHMLIERKGISSEEKIFYLKKYVGGEARKAIDGFFFTGSSTAYESAKEVLEERFGHPFMIQKAFRSKLEKWPHIPARDPKALREYAYFLRACKDASVQNSMLSILNDCVENQKMFTKLPDWASIKWNREVQHTLDGTGTYPPFEQFVNFVAKEARIACNPMSSPFTIENERKQRDTGPKRLNAKSLTTSASAHEPTVTLVKDANKQKVCLYCDKKNHFVSECFSFGQLAIDRKRSFIRENNLCFGCLRRGHINKECKNKLKCDTCKGRHPSCMHEERPTNAVVNDIRTATALSVNKNDELSTSMIVPVWLSSESDPRLEVLTYALLDTQSDTTFIHAETAAALQIKGNPIRLSLSTMTSEKTIIDSQKVTGLMVRGFTSNERLSVNCAYTRGFIPVDRSHIPTRQTARHWPHLREVSEEIAPLQSCDVGLLLGYNCPQALAPQQIVSGKGNEPYAVKTSLGWSVVGYAESAVGSSNVAFTCHRASVKELPVLCPKNIIKALEADFAHDTNEDIKVSQQDIRFLENITATIVQRTDTHLEMALPFKERPIMPNNKTLALIRLNHLKRKLNRDKCYHDNYTKCMTEMMDRGDAEAVPVNDSSVSPWYIPHHGVFHPKKPDKLRVVFDCSARYRNTSLNDHLLSGPDLTNGLAGVLLRFRRFPVAIMCDIEKMFHQFFVCEPDRDYLRFLWWEKGDTNLQPTEYRMRKHLFGAASSPGCANYGLKHLARIQEETFPQASSFVQNNFYVDDGLTSVRTEREAVELIRDTQTLCSNGGLRLHKFVSNRKSVIESVPVTERATHVSDLNMTLEKLPMERALGITWNIDRDMFKFNISVNDKTPTRRNMLSIIASIFDPLGFLSPLTLTGKQILQEACHSGVGWDDHLPNEKGPMWNDWIKSLDGLQQLNIPRCVIPNSFDDDTSIELHHFSDASSYGYGQCSYIRLVGNKNVHCALLIAKARVAPLTIVTIPRLELTAAVLSVKMSRFLRKELHLTVDREYFWTDSRVVLGYINNEARRFHVFVANRVQTIRQTTEPCQWFYVQSSDNPADHASRGLSVSEIPGSTWFSGPSFLWQQHIQTESFVPELQLGDPEVKSAVSFHTETTESPNIFNLLERFSSWSTAVSVIARLQRLSNGVKGTHSPTVEERRKAESTIIKLVQRDAFSDAIDSLQSSATLPKTNNLYNLDPMLNDGMLRVASRLRKASLPEACKFPAIIPKSGHVTKLILSHAHQKAEHTGRGFTQNKIRSLGYWIVGGSKVVANFLRQCVVCRKLRRPTEIQKMADLPQDRVEENPPFTYCGMDCFGPFLVKQGRKEVKRYGLLLTCMCSRAIHIEMLDDMSTDAFINGLRCFIAIRGAVRQIRSDKGSNFIGARNELEGKVKMGKVTSFLAGKQCDFVMNAPDASHTGGVWERHIRTIRNILNSVTLLCPGRLDDASLRTLFYEVMAIVNCRPLTVTDINDPSALEPLTPNHVLTGKSDIPAPPPGEFIREDMFLRKRWRRVQYLLEQFWSRWQKEYLAEAAHRQKWHSRSRNISVGDIVLVKDSDLSRNQWPLAIVVEAISDDDDLVRRVKVKVGHRGTLSQSVLERSVHKLVLLVEKERQ